MGAFKQAAEFFVYEFLECFFLYDAEKAVGGDLLVYPPVVFHDVLYHLVYQDNDMGFVGILDIVEDIVIAVGPQELEIPAKREPEKVRGTHI